MNRTLADIVSLVRGNTYDGKLVGEPGVALLGLGSIKPGGGFRRDGFNTFGGESPDKISLKPGELYVALKEVVNDGSMLGSVARLPPDIPKGRLTQDTVKLVFKDASDQLRTFVYWWLQTPHYRRYCGAHSTGTTTMALQRNDFLAYPVPEPTERQVSIAQRLDDIEELQSVLTAQNQILEDIARAVFKSWFIDFDPVHAKANGEPTGLPSEIDALFPSRFEEMDEGRVPEGWPQCPLAEQVTVTRGLSYSGAGLGKAEDGVPMHNLNSIYEGGGYKMAGLKRFTGDFKERHIAKPGDVLVANTEQGFERLLIGYPALVPDAWDGPTIFSHHLYKVDPKPDARVTRDYLAYWLKDPTIHDWVSGFANGTTVNMLPKDALELPIMVLPPFGLVEAFSRTIRAFHAKMELNEAQANTLEELRDLLLPKLISGELQAPHEVVA